MKTLIIPDVHLKPWIFTRASEILNSGKADIAVSLGDVPDDFNQEINLDLYEETFDEAIWFAKRFPSTLWCLGNHDIAYLEDGYYQSGYSGFAKETAELKLSELMQVSGEDHFGIIHRIDQVLFSHAGLHDKFVKRKLPALDNNDVDRILTEINSMHIAELWSNDSPLWIRPQYDCLEYSMYHCDRFLQVVGHTPMNHITRSHNLISTDVFSTYSDGTPLGIQEFMIIDTETWEYELIPYESSTLIY